MTEASDILRQYKTREDIRQAIANSSCVRTFDRQYNYYTFEDGSKIRRDTAIYSSTSLGAYYKDYELL